MSRLLRRAVIAPFVTLIVVGATAIPAFAATWYYSGTTLQLTDVASSGNNVQTSLGTDTATISIPYSDELQYAGCVQYKNGATWAPMTGTHSLPILMSGYDYLSSSTINYSYPPAADQPDINSNGGSNGCTANFDTNALDVLGQFTFATQWDGSGTGGGCTTPSGAVYCEPQSGYQASVTVNVDGQPAQWSSSPASSATAWVGSPFSYTFQVSGFPIPNFSNGGSLPPGLTFHDNGNGTATISGTPTSAGVWTTSVQASNSINSGQFNTGSTSTDQMTITVDQAPSFTSASSTTFTAGTYGSFNVSASGYPAPSLSESGSLPAGVGFVDNGNGTGSLYGAPLSGTGGTYNFTLTASNGSGSAQQTFTLTVDQGVTITSAASTTFDAGAHGSFQMSATGTPTPTFSESGALPGGISFTSGGLLSGTPVAGSGGTYVVTITASNGVGPAAQQTFTLTVEQSPTITSAPGATFNAGAHGSFQVIASGSPTPTFSESGALPGGLNFTSGGLLTGTPVPGSGGTYVITITASNGVGSNATQTFTLTVDEGPSITSASSTTFTVGSSGSFAFTSSGYPSPTYSVVSGSLPSGVGLSGAGVLSGNPAGGTGGTWTFKVSASNGSGSAQQTFTLTVDEGPSITSASSTTFTVGSSGSFAFTSSGYPSPTYSVVSGSLPGGVALSSGGVLSGTPSTTGQFTISVEASNSSGSSSQSFTLTVDQGASITSSAGVTFQAGQPGSFTVSTSGYPSPAISETGALPSGVTFTDNSDGTATLVGTPGAGTGGAYSITITASNGVGSAAQQTFVLDVNQDPSITSSSLTTFTTGTVGTFTFVASGFPAPLFTETGALPSGVTLSSSGVLSGTPGASAGGLYQFTVAATNSSGSAQQVFSLTVNQAPQLSWTPGTFTVGTAGSSTINASGYPAPSFSISGSVPTGLTLIDNGNGSATLSGTPAASMGGQHSVIVTASSSAGRAQQTFTVTVDEAPAVTSSAGATFTTGANGSFTITSSGYPASSFSESGSLPSGLSLGAGGVLSGTPVANSGGSYPISITASNGVGSPATQTLTITVDQAPGAIGPSSLTLTVGQAASTPLLSPGYPTATFTVNGGALPSGLMLSNGVLSGTPASGTGNLYGVTVSATNTAGSATQQTEVTIDEPPASINAPSSLTMTQGQQFAETVGVPQGTYPTAAFSETGAIPSGLSFRDEGNGSAVLSGIPSAPPGAYGVTVVATSGGTTVTAPMTINIVGASAPSGGSSSNDGSGGTGSSSSSGGGGSPSTSTGSSDFSASSSSSSGNGAAVAQTFNSLLEVGRGEALASSSGPNVTALKGRLPATYDLLNAQRGKPLAAAPRLGYDASFPLLGNVGTNGDCAVVSVAEIATTDRIAGLIRKLPRFSTPEALTEWSKLNGGNGAGLTDTQILGAWRSGQGVLGTKIKGWTSLGTSNVTAIKKAIVKTGALYAGLVIPESFAANTPSLFTGPIEQTAAATGHALAIVGYTKTAFIAVTWSRVVEISFSFFQSHAEATYAVSWAKG